MPEDQEAFCHTPIIAAPLLLLQLIETFRSKLMPKKILLADDSITIQKVVELTFSDGDYEVTAVNNGAKAIQKLSEMRPDIILSDIIMPEKNGYEVCEYVKSHPEFRTIPVVLLTGTFEPFDPDRADKAGCDAVVTKPFESQSLIHKVEELVESARSMAKTQPPSPSPFAASSSPFAGESAFSSASPSTTPTPPRGDQFSTGSFQPHSSDIFNAPPSSSTPSKDMPFESSPPPTPEGETRAFPKMNCDEMQKMSEPSTSGGETRAFPRMNFDEPPRSADEKGSSSTPASPPPTSPWHDDTPPVETRAFPRMSFDDLKKEPEAKPAPPTPWVEQESFAGETRAFPRLSFDESNQPSSTSKAGEKTQQAPASSTASAELTDEQIDRIARRVVQMMSDQVVRTIAWEVIPDLAEMVVKERIRQLENES
jgi:CheY-like chemotaxis protein